MLKKTNLARKPGYWGLHHYAQAGNSVACWVKRIRAER